jgi:hypothetical protein
VVPSSIDGGIRNNGLASRLGRSNELGILLVLILLILAVGISNPNSGQSRRWPISALERLGSELSRSVLCSSCRWAKSICPPAQFTD